MEFQVKLGEIDDANLNDCLKIYNNMAMYMERTDPDYKKDQAENFMSIKDIDEIEGPLSAFIVPKAYHKTKVPCFYSSDVTAILKSNPEVSQSPKVSAGPASDVLNQETEPKRNLKELTEGQIYSKTMKLAKKLDAQMSEGGDCKSKPKVVEFGTEYIKMMQELITEALTKTLKDHPLDTIEVLFNDMSRTLQKARDPLSNLFDLNKDCQVADREYAKYHHAHDPQRTCGICPIMPRVKPLMLRDELAGLSLDIATPMDEIVKDNLDSAYYPYVVTPPHPDMEKALYPTNRAPIIMGAQDSEEISGLTYSMLKMGCLSDNPVMHGIAEKTLHSKYFTNNCKMEELFGTLNTFLTSCEASCSPKPSTSEDTPEPPAPTLNSEIVTLAQICLTVEMRIHYSYSKQMNFSKGNKPKSIHTFDDLRSLIELCYRKEEYAAQNAEVLGQLRLADLIKHDFSTKEMYYWGLKIFAIARSVLLLCLLRKHACLNPHEAVQFLHEHCCKSVKLYYGAKGTYPYADCQYGVEVIWEKVYRYMYKTESVRMFVEETEKLLRIRQETRKELGLTITKLFQLGTHAILPCALIYNVQGDRVSTSDKPSKVKPMSFNDIKSSMEAANLFVNNILEDYERVSFLDLNVDLLDKANAQLLKVRHAVLDKSERKKLEPQQFTKSRFTLPKIHINPSKTLILYIADGKVIPRSKINKRYLHNAMTKIVLRTDVEGGMGAEHSLIPVVDFCQSCLNGRQTQKEIYAKIPDMDLPSTSASQSLAEICCTCHLPVVDHCDIGVNPDMIHIPALTPMLDAHNKMMVYADNNRVFHLLPAKDVREAHKLIPKPERKTRFQNYIASTLPEQNVVKSVSEEVATIMGKISGNITYAEYDDLSAKCVTKVQEKDMTAEDYLQMYYMDIAKVYIATCKLMRTQLHEPAFFQTVAWAYSSKEPLLEKQIVLYVVDLCKNYGTGLLKHKQPVKRSTFRRMPANYEESLDEDVIEINPIDMLPNTPEIERSPKFNFVTCAKSNSSVSSFRPPLSEMEVWPGARKASSFAGESSGRRRTRDNSISKRSRARSSSSCSTKKIKSVEYVPTTSESDSEAD